MKSDGLKPATLQKLLLENIAKIFIIAISKDIYDEVFSKSGLLEF